MATCRTCTPISRSPTHWSPRWGDRAFLCRCADRTDESVHTPSFQGDAKHRTTVCNYTSENLEIPGLVLWTIPECRRRSSGAFAGYDGSSALGLRVRHGVK